MTEKKDVEGFLETWNDEQERQKKAREAASAKEKLAEKAQVKKKTHTSPNLLLSTLYPLPRCTGSTQHPQQPIALLPWELAHTSPPEKKKEAISIYGPPMPHIPIPKRRGKGL